jgi:hypothetical protein
MRAKIWSGALECAGWPSPPAPLPFWERGDSGGRLWPPTAVDSHAEQLFCPPLNLLAGEGPLLGVGFLAMVSCELYRAV